VTGLWTYLAAGDRTLLLLIGIFTLQYVANW
jgi:hypothetical protein